MTDWPIERWLSDAEIAEVEYSTYWNDEDQERQKPFYVLDGDFAKMERYLEATELPRDLQTCAAVLRNEFGRSLAGVGVDLAAGNLWAVPHLLKLGSVDKLYCVEYSFHRLAKIGPRVLEHYGVPPAKIVLARGSFYDLHLADRSVDFVLLSQTFHHADRPGELLKEIRRVLKSSGVVIIIGEHNVREWRERIKHAVKFSISAFLPFAVQEKLFGRSFQVDISRGQTLGTLSDSILGDHLYTVRAYHQMFSSCGFKARRIRNRSTNYQSFVLTRTPS
jgi:SAM-dependent methyltransferase